MENWPTLQKQYFAALERYFEEWSERYTDLRLTTDIRVATWKGKRIQSKAEAGKWWFREALGVQDQSGKLLREQIVILGDPGGGKSTACQRATWELAREGRQTLDSSRRPITPVYLELGAYRKDSPQLRGLSPSQRMLRLLAHKIKLFLTNERTDWSQLQTYMDSSPFLFFLDGLNEVGQNQRHALIADIKSFIAQFSGQNHQFVLTTRKFDYEYDFVQHFPTDHFEPLEILELDSAGVNEFIMRDLGQIVQAYASVSKLPAEEQVIAKATLDALKIGDVTTGKNLLAEAQQLFANNPNIISNLENAQTLLDILRRPEYERVLWLAQNRGTLVDIIHVYQDKGSIPQSRTRLSEQAIKARLRTQAAKRASSKEPLRFSQSTKFDVLQAIGFYMMDVNKGLIIAHQDVIAIFAKYVCQEEAELLLNELIFSDGLLVEPEEKWYAFIKQPYQEYFVARELRERCNSVLDEGKEPLQDSRMQEFLQNPAYFQVTSAMAGLLPKEQALTFVTLLRKHKSTQRLAALCIRHIEDLPTNFIDDFVAWTREGIANAIRLAVIPVLRLLPIDQYIFNNDFMHYVEILHDLGPSAISVMIELQEELADTQHLSERIKDMIERTWASSPRTVLQVVEQESDYAQLILDCTTAIKLNPYDAVAYHNRGDAYSNLKQYDLAIADFDQAIELNSKDTFSYINRGFAYYRQGHYAQAIGNYTKAIELDPGNTTAHAGRAIVYWKQDREVQNFYSQGLEHQKKRDYERAITDYNRVIELNPEYADVYFCRGLAHHDQGDYEQAISDFTKVIQLNPEEVLAYNKRGMGHHNQGDYELAIADFTKAIELNPDDADTYCRRGFAHYYQGDYELVIADFTKVIQLNPDNAEAYWGRGMAYDDMGNYEGAIADYNHVLQLNPDDAEIYWRRGMAYNYQGNYERAIADFTKAIELNPGYATPYNNRGMTYDDMGDYERAIADFTKAIELNLGYATPYKNREMAYDNMGDYEPVITDYNQAIQLNAEYASTYNNRGFAYAKQGNYDKAIIDCTRAIELNPDFAPAYHSRGFAYAKQGQYDKAIVDFNRSSKLDPTIVDTYHDRGIVYQKLGEKEKAIADFRRCLELKAAAEWHEKAKKRLQELGALQ